MISAVKNLLRDFVSPNPHDTVIFIEQDSLRYAKIRFIVFITRTCKGISVPCPIKITVLSLVPYVTVLQAREGEILFIILLKQNDLSRYSSTNIILLFSIHSGYGNLIVLNFSGNVTSINSSLINTTVPNPRSVAFTRLPLFIIVLSFPY